MATVKFDSQQRYHDTNAAYVVPKVNDIVEQNRLDTQAAAIVEMIGGFPLLTSLQTLDNISKVLFRAAYRARVMSYLQEPAPERLVMTAGKPVLENSDTKSLDDALRPLDDMLAGKLKETAIVGTISAGA